MENTKRNLWNTYLCNRLASIEADIRTGRRIRLAVITVIIALIGVLRYLFSNYFDNNITMYIIISLTAVILSIIWYISFSIAFFLSDEMMKKYEDLILKNIMGNLTNNEILKEYYMIKQRESKLGIKILKGRFWRKIFKLK